VDKHFVFNVLAFLFSAGTYVLYLIPIVRKKETTKLSTWMAWLVMDSAILFMMVKEHKVSYQLVAYAIGCVVVLFVGWRIKAAAKWKSYDTACMVLVAVAVLLWSVTGNSSLAVTIELIAMGVGSIPLFNHIWESPNPASPWAWLCNLIGATFAVPAVEHWDMVGAAGPLVFLILSVIFNTAVLRTHRNNKFLIKVLMLD